MNYPICPRCGADWSENENMLLLFGKNIRYMICSANCGVSYYPNSPEEISLHVPPYKLFWFGVYCILQVDGTSNTIFLSPSDTPKTITKDAIEMLLVFQ